MLRFLNGRNTITGNVLHQLVCAAILGQYSASAVEGDSTNSKDSNIQCFRIPRRQALAQCKKPSSISIHRSINHTLPVRMLQSLRVVQLMSVGVKVHARLKPYRLVLSQMLS
jgi:hypothetical protein